MKQADMTILNDLKFLSEKKYKLFNAKIVPTKQTMLGVRVPLLRKIAKEIIQNEPMKFIKLDKQNIYEMVLLEGIVLSYMEQSFQELLPIIEDYLDKVDNWAQIDTPILSFKSIEKDKVFVYSVASRWLVSDKEYVVRAALVILLNYFVQKEYLQDIFIFSQELKHDGYYVYMANAWLISVCMAKFPNETMSFFKSNTLDKKTHNKAIQKSIESFRVSKYNKSILKKLRV